MGRNSFLTKKRKTLSIVEILELRSRGTSITYIMIYNYWFNLRENSFNDIRHKLDTPDMTNFLIDSIIKKKLRI